MELTKELIKQYFNVTDEQIRLYKSENDYYVSIFYPLPLGYYDMETHQDFGLAITIDNTMEDKDIYLSIIIECGVEPYVIYDSKYTEEKPPKEIVSMLIFAQQKITQFLNTFRSVLKV